MLWTLIRRVPTDIAVLSLILLLALAARIAWVLWVQFDPTDPNIVGVGTDSRVYHRLAEQFAAGCGYCREDGTPAVLYAPGYPFFLGSLYWIVDSYVVGQAANIILTTLNVGLVFLIARRIAGRNAALAAAGLYAFLPSNAMFSSLLMSEPLFTALLLLVLLLTLRGASPVIIGALIGLSALVRGQGLVLLLPVAVFATVRLGWQVSLRRYVLPMTLVSALVLVPWAVRNYVQFDSFVLVSTGAADTFWRGNREGGDGRQPARGTPRPTGEGPIGTYRAKMRENLRFVREHPLEFFVTLPPRKLYYMYDNDTFHVSANRAGSPRRDNGVAQRAITQVSDFGYFGILALAAVAAPTWIRKRPEAILLIVTFVAWAVFHLAFLGDSRYHFPVLPIWAIWAGMGLAVMWRGSRTLDGNVET